MIETTTGYVHQNSNEILSTLGSFFSSPFKNQNMVWVIIPLVFVLIVMEVYWAYYKSEEIGWDTITGNSLVLIFISMDLFRFLSNNGFLEFTRFGTYESSLSTFVLLMFLSGIGLFVLDFFRLWPKFIAYKITSAFSINLLAYILVIIVYMQIPLNMSTLIAGAIFFFGINTIFWLIRLFSPTYY